MTVTQAPQKKAPLWSVNYTKTYIMGVITNICFHTLLSTFALYLGPHGFGSESIGALASGYSVGAMLMRVLSGRWIDTQGCRRMGLLGALFFALPLLGYLAMDPSLPVTAVLRVMQGIGAASLNLALATMAAEVVHPQRFSQGVGYYGLTFSLGQAVGPTIGVTLLSRGYTKGLFSLDLVICLIAIVLLSTMVSVKPPKRAAEGSALEAEEDAPLPPWAQHPWLKPCWKFFAPEALPSAVVMFTVAVAASSLFTFLSPYMLSLGLKNPGTFFAVQAGLMIFSRLFASSLADRLGGGRLLLVGEGLIAAGYIFIATARGMGSILVAAGLYGMGAGLCYPTLQVFALDRTPRASRGRAISTTYASDDLGVGLGALVYGFVVSRLGYRSIYFISAALLLAALVISVRVFGKRGESFDE